MALTVGSVRGLVAAEELGWEPHRRLPDDTPVPHYATGASPEGLALQDRVSAIRFAALGAGSNTLLAERRQARGLLTPAPAGAPAPDAPPPAGAPSAIDWRNRWNRNWITSVRDQNPCNACWAFAGVALVEAMVRIEHSYWTRLSEGDVERGVGKSCPDLGNEGEVSTFFANNGIADPGSFPWTTTLTPYTPTPDRNGRSVRGPAFTLMSVADSKTWLDTVGPVITWFDVYQDFFGFGTGVYHRSTSPSNTEVGGHFMLVVGYDDSRKAWLVKNSWGTAWGEAGYGWIGYGESGIETYGRYGVRDVNPDPWTKRRLHNGNLYESGNGALHRNLEITGSNGSRVLHRWREGGAPWTWGTAASFATDAAVSPTLVGTTYGRNMEVVYTTTGGRLHHWWTGGSGSGPWKDGGVFGPAGCTTVPGFVQSDYNAPGNFEVVVAVGGRLQHVWRDGSGWHNGPTFGSGIARSGATLVQGDYGSPHGNLECVAVRTDGAMQHFWRNEPTFTWNVGATFGSGVATSPVMIQGQYGMRDERGPHGNFELCVAVGGRVQHWWRNNSGDGAWRHSATFGHDVASVTGLCESSYGMNLEVVVLRTDGRLQHYWRSGGTWHEGPVIGAA